MRTLASRRGPAVGPLASSHPAMTRARSGSSCKVFVVTRMVGPPLESARLELHAARGPPDAELLAAEQRARDLGHDCEHVETGEGVDSRIAEGGRLPGDDLLELHEVEEERIVAYPGEHRHPAAWGDAGPRKCMTWCPPVPVTNA